MATTADHHHPTDREGFAGAIAAGMTRISWSAIFAGTACAVGLQILFVLIGLGIGLGLPEPAEQTGLGLDSTWSYIYWAITSIVSLFAGGSVAGRVAGVPTGPASVVHGIVVWAIATILALWLAVSAASTVASGTIGVVRQTADTLSTAVSGAAEVIADIEAPGIVPTTEELRDIVPNELARAIEDAVPNVDLSAREIRAEADEIASRVIDEQQRQEAIQVLRSTLRDAIMTPGDAAQDFESGIDRLLGTGGVFTEEDVTELRNALQDRLGVTPQETQRILDAFEQRLEAAREDLNEGYGEAVQALQSAREEAVQAVGAASDAVQSAALWAALASFLGLLGAALGALLAKPDEVLGERVAERHQHGYDYGAYNREPRPGAPAPTTGTPLRDDPAARTVRRP